MILAATKATWPDRIGRPQCGADTRTGDAIDLELEFQQLIGDPPDDFFASPTSCPQQSEAGTKLTVTGVLRRYWPDYLEKHRPFLDEHQIDVMTQLVACRTEQLGGSVWNCADCGHQHIFYHSCGRRQCPTCGTARRDQWFEKALGESLPVAYTHYVMTAPHDYSELALANPKLVYALLMRCTREVIQRLAKELGVKASGVMVLHTWGQLWPAENMVLT